MTWASVRLVPYSASVTATSASVDSSSGWSSSTARSSTYERANTHVRAVLSSVRSTVSQSGEVSHGHGPES